MRQWTAWSTAAAWLLLIAAVLVQARAGWRTLGYDLASPDPPAHFTTGVMVFDYLKHGASTPPMRFAECFYVRYPKVAFGHWPPVFYVAETLWFLLFGVSVAAARWLCVAITAALAALVFQRCRVHWNPRTAPLAAAVFLCVPMIQSQAWEVMSDILVTFFVYLAIVRLAAWLDLRMPHDLWWCSAWCVLAILTKGTGWVLLPLLLIAPLLAGRTSVYRHRIYWLAIFLVTAAGAPFFLYMDALHLGYPAGIAFQLKTMPNARSAVGLIVWAIAAILLAALAYFVRRHPPRTARQLTCFLSALWIVGQAVFLAVFPYVADWHRFLMASLPMCVFLAAGVLSKLDSWIERWKLPTGVVSILAAAMAMLLFGFAHVDSVHGYAAAIDSIPLQKAGPAVLVESDASGEGAVIARRLEKDPLRATYMLRGTKMLAESTWMGSRYRSRYDQPEAVREMLDRIPVDYILFDSSVPTKADGVLLRTVLDGKDSEFELRSRQTITGRLQPGDVEIYQRRIPLASQQVHVSVTLDPERARRELSCPGNAW